MNLTKEDKQMVVDYILKHHDTYTGLKSEERTSSKIKLKADTTENLLNLFYQSGGAKLYTQEELI
ncbi:hypothetical protein WKH56_19795 [Priestia sp. SB1]|uniref:hypothetical protein n=1 Tax=Priestia sp. SB1 TaxID=3132359 RepID=UPI00317BE60C